MTTFHSLVLQSNTHNADGTYRTELKKHSKNGAYHFCTREGMSLQELVSECLKHELQERQNHPSAPEIVEPDQEMITMILRDIAGCIEENTLVWKVVVASVVGDGNDLLEISSKVLKRVREISDKIETRAGNES